ncbi:hypothetical protein SETIT_6G193300v2 [Setaria italica]|uniref:Uncharacterized protein n=1 Tax=Setaria italica TaxID=4555 RepID=A0A368RN95_SETIT|nr:hypothetical protein SETIT_6G193300v2 [Setaria italica]
MEAATSGQRAGSSSSTAPTYNGRLDAVTLVVSSMAPSSSTSLDIFACLHLITSVQHASIHLVVCSSLELSLCQNDGMSGWNSITSQNCQKVNSEGCFVGCLRGFCLLSSWIQRPISPM